MGGCCTPTNLITGKPLDEIPPAGVQVVGSTMADGDPYILASTTTVQFIPNERWVLDQIENEGTFATRFYVDSATKIQRPLLKGYFDPVGSKFLMNPGDCYHVSVNMFVNNATNGSGSTRLVLFTGRVDNVLPGYAQHTVDVRNDASDDYVVNVNFELYGFDVRTFEPVFGFWTPVATPNLQIRNLMLTIRKVRDGRITGTIDPDYIAFSAAGNGYGSGEFSGGPPGPP